MKAFLQIKGRRNCLLALLMLMMSLFGVQNINAQPPDCVSGNVAYAVFNDSIGSTYSSVLDSLELRPVNLLTGAVGSLVGGKRYFVRKLIGATYYYGSSALAVDFSSGKFFVMTQMSNAGAKDIVAIDPLLATTTIIGTTPTALDGYHFVKMTAHATNGWMYAIGVHRDSTTAANLVNPLVRFPVCATANCATANIQILGYLPSTGVMYKWKLFNGDIAFDNNGNLYFATAAFEYVNSNSRYTDSRLFRINAVDIPTSAGAGTIPMTLVADYNTLDSTVINGIAFNSVGTMFFTTRTFNGPQNASPVATFNSKLFQSTTLGTATLMPAFAPPTAGTSVSDLATCYFPQAVLSSHRISLTGQYVSGKYNLNWEAVANPEIRYFVIQKGTDGVSFNDGERVEVINNGSAAEKYMRIDEGYANASSMYYRIMEMTSSGMRVYSNIVRIAGTKISLTKKISPNPFSNRLDISLNLRIPADVHIAMLDQNGRLVYRNSFSKNAGDNIIQLTDVPMLKPGVYFIEIVSGDEIIREKIVKQ